MREPGNRKNWLAEEDPKKVVDHLVSRHSQAVWNSNPVMQAWVRNIYAYYSAILEPGSWDTSLVFDGKQGELVKMVVPQARSLVRQLVTLVTKQKMAYQATSQSDTGDVVEETRLANALVEQVLDKERCDQKGEIMAEFAAVTGQGIMGALWRTDRGDPYAVDPDSRSIIYGGEIEIVTPHAMDCFYDYTIPEWENIPDFEVRVQKNRWDLIAQFPELHDELMKVDSARSGRGSWKENGSESATDMISCYEFYVRPSAALPNGRMMFYASPKAIFSDGPNEYGTIPFEVMRPEPIMGMGFGYPILSNLLPAQEMMDHSFSAIATNQSAFAVQTVTVPRGAGISVQEINGMNFLSFTPMANVSGGGRPEPLQMSQSAPETFKFIDLLKGHMLEISNLNASIRGAPPPGVTSGTAIATLSTNALEFLSSAQRSYTQTMERVMSHVVSAYAKFAKVDHNVIVTGKNSQSSNRKFSGDDLGSIAGVKITVANPLMQTMSGRLELADKLSERGLIKTAQDYLLILEGAPTRKLYETELSEADLLQSENDMLSEGQDVPVLIDDDHAAHYRKHTMLTNDPKVRLNGKALAVITAHKEKHLELGRTQDPLMAAYARTGKQPDPATMPPPSAGPGMAPPGQMMPSDGQPTGEPTEKPAEPTPDLLGRQPAPSGQGGQ